MVSVDASVSGLGGVAPVVEGQVEGEVHLLSLPVQPRISQVGVHLSIRQPDGVQPHLGTGETRGANT